ncbi:MAG TPA: hypothetical protein DCQ36_14035, partial [Actinobacteria bacterium]|nr:hypothetical protein [Actinomycetota bacterium]
SALGGPQNLQNLPVARAVVRGSLHRCKAGLSRAPGRGSPQRRATLQICIGDHAEGVSTATTA